MKRPGPAAWLVLAAVAVAAAAAVLAALSDLLRCDHEDADPGDADGREGVYPGVLPLYVPSGFLAMDQERDG